MEQDALPECELLFENGDDLDTLRYKCSKNPGHKNFIPITQLQPHHVPTDNPEEARYITDWILYYSNFTVKIIVNHVSKDRPNTYWNSTTSYPFSRYKDVSRLKRYGTGLLNVAGKEHVSQTCPCPLCQEQGGALAKNEYWTVIVSTASHVVFDNCEAKSSIIECFFDSEKDRELNRVKVLYGVGLDEFRNKGDSNRCQTDKVFVKCVTHDKDLITKFGVFQPPSKAHQKQSVYPRKRWPCLGFIISHPHGLAKAVTFGRILDLFSRSYSLPGPPFKFDGGKKCRLPLLPWSGFQDTRRGRDNVLDNERNENNSLKLEPNSKNMLQGVDMATNSQAKGDNNENVMSPKNVETEKSYSDNIINSNYSLALECDILEESLSDVRIHFKKNYNETDIQQIKEVNSKSSTCGNSPPPPPPPPPSPPPPSSSSSSSSPSSSLKLTPGTEFDLPEGLTYTLPKDAIFSYQYRHPGSLWYSLPKGTQFYLSNGCEVFFPPEAEFYKANNWLTGCWQTYTIPTCPGSSGASIFMVIDPVMIHDGGHSHFGSTPYYGLSGGWSLVLIQEGGHLPPGSKDNHDPAKHDYF